MRLETKQLYRPNEQSTWNEWNPVCSQNDIDTSSYTQECALIVHQEPHPSKSDKAAIHSITVQSPLIKKVLEGTFEGYEGLNTQLKHLTFKAPFYPFYYRWHIFQNLRYNEQDQEARSHVDLLYDVLSKEILPYIDAMEDFIKNNVMSFDYLWTLFAPGMELYAKIGGHDRIVSLTAGRYGASMSGEFFALEFRYIDCDGSNFGYVESSLEIGSFSGVKKLMDLDAIPCHLYPNVESLVEKLFERGKRFEQLNGLYHMSYSGFYKSRSTRQVRRRHVENGRIIVDPYTFNGYNMAETNLEPIESNSPSVTADKNPIGHPPSVIYNASNEAFQNYQKILAKILSYRGGDLQAEFDIEKVSPIRWNENAFTRLVLPNGYKSIIRAFVEEQLSRDDGFDDIIVGKGLGFIMLLSGEPGVGKTLTADSVAEEMHRPLYSMSGGELGETAAEVEDSLDLILELTTAWNAILLLDECDIFLAARTTADIRRNRLISIFLRKLEYYRGIMFLTTNRSSDFDAAFESRIHLTIHYPSLSTANRLYIWKTFVSTRGSESRLTDSDLEILAENELNGRQIKNIVKAGRLLSRQQKVPLGMEHIELVLRVKRGNFG